MAKTENRAEVLRRLQELREHRLDALNTDFSANVFCELVRHVTGADAVAVNLFDDAVQWPAGTCGLTEAVVPAGETVCQYAIDRDDGFFEVEDLAADPRFANIPFRAKLPHLRYYLGVPLRMNSGVAIGVFCLFGKKPMPDRDKNLEVLRSTSLCLVEFLEERKRRIREMEAHESIARYLKKVAHDIRSPLASICSLAELAAQDGVDVDKDEYIDLMWRSARALMSYTEGQLMALIRREDDTEHSITVAALLEQVDDLYSVQAAFKEISLICTADDAVRAIKLPHTPSEMVHLLGNLVSNAIKFTPVGGAVTVTVRTILESASEGREAICIAVKDTGRGMGPSEVAAIRQGVTQMVNNGSLGEKGFGLGLYQALSTLKGIGGSFSIDTALSEGTTFTLLIPRDRKRDEEAGDLEVQ